MPAISANYTAAVPRRRFTVAAGLIFTLSLLMLPERATGLGEPQAVVAYVAAQGMATLGPNVAPAQRDASLRGLFEHYFDGDGSAEFALGRYRSIATPLQQQEYFRLYAEYTVRTFGTQLNQIGAAPFRVTGGRSSGRQAVVTSEISRPGGNSVELVWSLINRHGQFKITDLSIGGESMRVTQREEFSRWIQNNGGRFDALLAVMRQQISQMR
ncbi:MAG TPA: ABC transporter substrate-binding protein [Stellaceae bacterium]|jgi:ABC-type transporter MlaC component|nr:ABC transporter substrate-binding protein [Stellaceae bacterium]